MGGCFYSWQNLLPPYLLHSQGNKNKITTIFQQPSLFNQTLPNPYDATKTGPVCPQGSLNPDAVDILVETKAEDLLIGTALVDCVVFYCFILQLNS